MNDIINDNQQKSDSEIWQENSVQNVKRYGFYNKLIFCILGILIFFSTIISEIIFTTTVKIKGNWSKRNNKNNYNDNNDNYNSQENTNSEACIPKCLYCEEYYIFTKRSEGLYRK